MVATSTRSRVRNHTISCVPDPHRAWTQTGSEVGQFSKTATCKNGHPWNADIEYRAPGTGRRTCHICKLARSSRRKAEARVRGQRADYSANCRGGEHGRCSGNRNSLSGGTRRLCECGCHAGRAGSAHVTNEAELAAATAGLDTPQG